MKNQMRSNSSAPRKFWLVAGSLPALLLASGMVMTQAHADYDENDAESSESYSATEVASDGWITTKVKSKLLADQEVSGFDISVETRESVVYLTGEVENQSQVSHAVDIAEKTEGVDRVDAVSLRIDTAFEQGRDALDIN